MQKSTRPTLGVLVTSLDDRYQSIIWSGICKEARFFDVNLLCYKGAHLNTPDKIVHPATILYELAKYNRPDGIIILTSAVGTFCSASELEDFFSMYAPLPLISAGYLMPGYSSITVDNYTGMEQLITHLIKDHQYKNFLFISGPESHWESKDRYQAYCTTIKKFDIDPSLQLIYEGTFIQESGNSAIGNFSAQQLQNIDAIIASNDSMAFGAIEELQSKGFKIPEDIAVVGFDDTEDCQFSLPLLTTVTQPLERIGRNAVQRMMNLIKTDKTCTLDQLPSQLKIRESCGCLHKPLPRLLIPRLMEKATLKVSAGLLETLLENQPALQPLLQFPHLMEFLHTALEKLQDALDTGKEEFFLTFWQQSVRQGQFSAPELHLLSRFLTVMISHFNENHTGLPQLPVILLLLYQNRDYQQGLEYRLRAQQYLRYERMSLNLNNLSTQLMSAFTDTGLKAVINECMQELQIPHLFLCLYDSEDDTSLPAHAHLFHCYPGYAPSYPAIHDVSFSTAELIPDFFSGELNKYTFIIQALYVQQTQIGYIVTEMGPAYGEIYDTLRLKISTALNSLNLINRVRNHAQELEKEVVRRTADLVGTNEELTHQIQQRQQAEAALIENEKTLRSLTDAIPVPLFIMRYADTEILYRNDPFQNCFQPPQGPSGLLDFSQSPEVIREVLNRLQETDTVSEVELKLAKPAGPTIWMVATFRRIKFRGDDAVIVGLNDITAIKNLQATILEVVEKEQRRIGLDLHDDVCQNLAGISVMTTALGLELKALDEALAKKMNAIAVLIGQSVSAISKISRGLFPSDLDSSGLTFALLQIVKQAEEQFGRHCEARIDEKIKIEDKEKQLHLFRIGQELIYNAFKHANASKISLHLYQEANVVKLSVIDNGHGFKLDTHKTRGMGLRSIIYRAQLIDANLNFYQTEGGGITACCSVQV